uniref:Cytochrome b n=1 Tax=Romanomermis nielseni TaxID=416167 RepID=A1Z3A1_9BILA|nr:cytochrome b [Romanomermis nielseni]ABL73784.1 cytochrome b [Romanomermis nielseni]
MYLFLINKIMKIILFSPMNLSYWWNIGSLLFMLMLIQIFSGFLLTLFYDNSATSFTSIWLIHMEVFFGAILHYTHLNFSSFIFLFIYLHLVKAFFLNSYLNLKMVWVTGWLILMLIMMVAFLGYVLPWGQMSLWGATVITNLLSTLPWGLELVQWIWGGYFVSIITLKLFFSIHFILPFVLLILIMSHMIMLHYSGSSNPLGSFSNMIKSEFSLVYLFKDLLNLWMILVLIIFSLINSFKLSDPENFILANSLVSPIHIQPEWYFLQYYAILRAIPSKLGGVLLFLMSLVMIFMMIYFNSYYTNLDKMTMLMNVSFILINILLMWLGGQLVEAPYLNLSQIISMFYFTWFLVKLYLLKISQNN